uniref:Calcipressin family protein n=1 Tax=Colletotrichum fructicola (strain Nara gc5) TaxID=1213859 RepID=L2G258_COLFN
MEPPKSDSRPIFSRRSTGSNKSLSLDLSSLPPLVQPTPPSNTLLLTNLNDTNVFRPDNLQTIRDLISKTAPIHSFAPLKSFRRIVRVRVYFGQPTPVEVTDRHLALPDAGKLFFISPPPSPPHGWEMKLEDAPNKMVHAEDLAEALAKLGHRPSGVETPISPIDGSHQTRSRSSTLLYKPDAQGDSPDLPAICLEDMTDEPMEFSPIENTKPIMAHTSRPPVELMMDA